MNTLTQIIKLFETDDSFLKGWNALDSKKGASPEIQKIIKVLKDKKHLKKRPMLFGM